MDRRISAWMETITEEEAAVAELVIRHYTNPDVRPYPANTSRTPAASRSGG